MHSTHSWVHGEVASCLVIYGMAEHTLYIFSVSSLSWLQQGGLLPGDSWRQLSGELFTWSYFDPHIHTPIYTHTHTNRYAQTGILCSHTCLFKMSNETMNIHVTTIKGALREKLSERNNTWPQLASLAREIHKELYLVSCFVAAVGCLNCSIRVCT